MSFALLYPNRERRPDWPGYAAFLSLFCCPFNFAHRAFWAAAILRRAAADMWRGLEALPPFSRARRARWAAAIRARAAADTMRPVVERLRPRLPPRPAGLRCSRVRIA